MNNQRLLLTGDFWHADFQAILSSFQIPVTLVPIGKIEALADSEFDLVVIAQSHRDQIANSDIETIHRLFAGTPVIALLGSWCEGETRSGTPWPGVTRVYWHQWQGRYETFLEQLAAASNGGPVPSWSLPRTSTGGDRILSATELPRSDVKGSEIESVAISAWTPTQHEMIADAIGHFGWSSHWIERDMMDGEAVKRMSVICVEADSWSPELNHRLRWIKKEVSAAPMVLLLNYPRQDELDEIHRAGVSEVVSKPFELADLKSAICRAVKGQRQTGSKIACDLGAVVKPYET